MGRTDWNKWNGGAVRIAVGPDGNAWVVDNAGFIYCFDGFMFQKLPGSAHDIGVGADGSAWVIGTRRNRVASAFGGGAGQTGINGTAVRCGSRSARTATRGW